MPKLLSLMLPRISYTGSFRPPRATLVYEVRAQQEKRKVVGLCTTTVAANKNCSPQGARSALHGSQSRSGRTHRRFGVFYVVAVLCKTFFVDLWGQTSCDRTESPRLYQLPLFFVIRNLKTGSYFTLVVHRSEGETTLQPRLSREAG